VQAADCHTDTSSSVVGIGTTNCIAQLQLHKLDSNSNNNNNNNNNPDSLVTNTQA
jgi:hypothetical protein